MSTNAGAKLKAIVNRQKKKLKNIERKESTTESRSDGNIVLSLPVPSLSPSKSNTDQESSSNLDLSPKGTSKSTLKISAALVAARKISSRTLRKKKNKKQSKKQFSEDPGVDDQVLRSPSRLGYSEDIPVIIEGAWENTSQDSNREDFKFLDLKGINQLEAYHLDSKFKKSVQVETKETGQQTDFPLTPSTPQLSSERVDIEKPKRHFITSHKYLNENNPGSSPKHPYEKTVFLVKSAGDNKLVKSDTPTYKSVTHRPLSSHTDHTPKSVQPSTDRIDSGYASRQETIRIPGSPYKPQSPTSAKSFSDKVTILTDTQCSSPDRISTGTGKTGDFVDVDKETNQSSKIPANMSYYITETYSPPSSSRKQEKEELQLLNERFSSYVQKVRVLSEQSNRMDSNTFMKQTRILEEEVANLKTMYERELDALRQDINATHRESHNYQIQCEKNKQAAIDFESRLAVETDKSRRLMDDINLLQQKVCNLEAELMGLRQAGDGRADFQSLQREMDKIIRENEDYKHRQEQASLFRSEAEDRCHTLTKKLEFNEQVHAQQLAELRERLEQSQATIISLESRVREASKLETSMPDVLKQVREQAEMELKRFQLETEENYNRNISALKCQMDNDANTIERITNDKALLQGQIGELSAKIRTLEGQLITFEHQKNTAEEMIRQERTRSTSQVHEMEKKLRDMHELVFTKMREAGTARDLHLPLKAEIEAMKVLLEEEERRLQTPVTSISHQQTTYAPSVPVNLPAVSSGPITTSVSQYQYTTPTQHISALESPFITQSAAHNQYTQQIDQQEPLFTQVSQPCETASGHEYNGSTRYTYETTPSVNRLHIDNPPRNSPRVVGPISRAKSAPVHRGQHVPLVPTALGQGKDYFDEMFRDLTRETLYTQTRPKSSPLERPPSGARDRPPSASGERTVGNVRERPASRERPVSAARERPASAAQERPPSRERPSSQTEMTEVLEQTEQSATNVLQLDQPLTTGKDYTSTEPERRLADRPQSSVFHDYTTTTSRILNLNITAAVGDIKIHEVNQEGRFVRLVNEGKQELEFGGYMIQQNVGGHPVAVFRFPPRTKFADNSTITIWSGATEEIEHQPPKNFVWKEQHKWGTGPECTTILCKPNGQAIAWMTAAHRFSKNPYDDSQERPHSEEEFIPDTGVPASTQEEILTEMNVNLNEPKADPVYLRREKQAPPSLIAQKHPHGTSPGKETHPHTGQPRPFTYGNDNSSVNRQSRIQSTRPDPVPGQPYAGGSANRIGSAPLRKYTGTSATIRGSGAIANRSDPGLTSPPPTAFQTPHKRFDTAMEQIQSQHHVDFLPPMPRPPLFSTW